MAPSGSNWTLSPVSNPGQCLDAGAGTNGTGLVLGACNGGASQNWNITANAMNGSFNVAAASTGRCMNVRGGSTRPAPSWRSTTARPADQPAVQHPGDRLRRRHRQPGPAPVAPGGYGRHGWQHPDVCLVADLPHGSAERDRRVDRRLQRRTDQRYLRAAVLDYGGDIRRPSTCLANGSNWTISMSANRNKCLGPNNNGTANGTTIVIQDCNG